MTADEKAAAMGAAARPYASRADRGGPDGVFYFNGEAVSS